MYHPEKPSFSTDPSRNSAYPSSPSEPHCRFCDKTSRAVKTILQKCGHIYCTDCINYFDLKVCPVDKITITKISPTPYAPMDQFTKEGIDSVKNTSKPKPGIFNSTKIQSWHSKEKIESLLDQGVDVNSQDRDGNTALHDPVSLGLEKVQLLIKRGADVNALNNKGQTPLIALAKLCYSPEDLNLADLFLKNGANINHRDHEGNTMLHHVILSSIYRRKSWRDMEIMIITLLERGADPLIRNNSMKDAKDLVKEMFFWVRPLTFPTLPIKTSPKPSDNFFKTSNEKKEESPHQLPKPRIFNFPKFQSWYPKEEIESLLDKGVDPNSHDEAGNTALHCPSFGFDKLELLIKRGADVNAVNNKGETPLIAFASKGYVSKDCLKIIDLLLRNKANINRRDNEGNTMLHHVFLASRSSPKSWREMETIILSLLERGADPLIRNRGLKNAEDLAKEIYDYLDIEFPRIPTKKDSPKPPTSMPIPSSLFEPISLTEYLKTSNPTLDLNKDPKKHPLAFLGIPRSVSITGKDEEAFKKYYKKLSLKYHPDRATTNEIDPTRANEIFQMIRQAIEALGVD